jgi:carboxymethylenebutenolidase
MSQVNPKELHPEVWKLFDRYVHGLIDRRGFLDGTAKYAVGGVTAVGILEALAPNYAEAQIQVQPNDSRIKTERIDVKSPEGHGTIKALLARPANATGRIPAVVVGCSLGLRNEGRVLVVCAAAGRSLPRWTNAVC